MPWQPHAVGAAGTYCPAPTAAGSDASSPAERGRGKAGVQRCRRRLPVGSARGAERPRTRARAAYLQPPPTAGQPPWRFCCASCSCAESRVSGRCLVSSTLPARGRSLPAATREQWVWGRGRDLGVAAALAGGHNCTGVILQCRAREPGGWDGPEGSSSGGVACLRCHGRAEDRARW